LLLALRSAYKKLKTAVSAEFHMVTYKRSRIRAWAKSKIPFLWEKRLGIASAIIGLVLLFLFRDVIQMLVVMAAFIILGVASLIYNRWIKLSLGFELIMLGIVVTGMAYGRWQAFVVGFIALFFAEVITNRFTYSTFISFIGIFIVSMTIPLFQNTGVTWVGICMTLIYDAIIGPGYILMGSSPWRTLLFVATHAIFNIWVFIFIAPWVFRLLA
jgi:hypothetical protein